MATGWFQKKETTGGSATPKAPAMKASQPARSAKTVRISDLLTPEMIVISPVGADKNSLLEALVGRLVPKVGLNDAAGILAKVYEREQGISTTLDTGLSLPHVRLDGIKDIVAAMAIVPGGIPDPKQADLTIRVMFLFFSPNKPESFPLHLQLLRGVSSLFQPAAIDQLVSAAAPEAALALIKSLEA